MEKKNTVQRKSYTAMFKLEVVDFAKGKGDHEAARKFNVRETSIWEWRKEEEVIKCLHQKKHAMRYRRCFWPELEKTLVEWVLRFTLYSCICDMKYLYKQNFRK
jgi:transposase-like protein